MIDPNTITTLTHGSITIVVIKKAGDLLNRICGPTVDELGQVVRQWSAPKLRNLFNVAAKAQESLDTANIEPQQVKMTLLQPIIINSSLEDDETLQERWAALLANAASGASDTPVLNSFPDILRQLSAIEARLLDRMYKKAEVSGDAVSSYLLSQAVLTWKIAFCEVLTGRNSVEGELHRPELSEQLEVVLDNLERLGIMARTFGSKTIASESIVPLHLTSYTITRFGVQFIRACQPPASGISERCQS